MSHGADFAALSEAERDGDNSQTDRLPTGGMLSACKQLLTKKKPEIRYKRVKVSQRVNCHIRLRDIRRSNELSAFSGLWPEISLEILWLEIC